MLTEVYIEALLVDEELADQVWEAWDAGGIDDQAACMAWMLIARIYSANDKHGDNGRASQSQPHPCPLLHIL